MRKELFPHQVRGLNQLKQSLGSGNRRPLLAAPTGSGKTVLASAIVEGALRKGKRVIFVVPAISLIDQTVRSFWAQGIRDVGVIQGIHPLTNYAMPIQVASVQTLKNRNIPHADLVVIDEAHRWFKFYAEWMARWDNTPFIGLSATPWTKGLGKYYDDFLICTTTAELIDQGYLSPFRVFGPSKPDLSGVRTVAGDYHEGDLAEAMDKPPLVADAVQNWLKNGENRPTLCFAVNRAHAKSLEGDFQRASVSTGYIDAYTDNDEREALFRAFQKGSIRVLCNVGCLTTGVDLDVRCIVLCRPTKSEMLFVQIIGRGLRTAEGKRDCIIFDHSDTHERLGFVTDIHHEELCDGKPKTASGSDKKTDPPLPKPCGKCKFIKPPKVHECPNCGFTPQKQSDIEVADGHLSEIKRKKKANKELSAAEKKDFYGELKFYARQYGYSDGWASHKYRSKTGVWPNAHKDAPPKEPTEATINFIKHETIKWAKNKGKARAAS